MTREQEQEHEEGSVRPVRPVRPTVPLGIDESLFIIIAVVFTIMVMLGVVGGGFAGLQALFVREVPSRPPVHEPLPDLCSVFTGASPAGLTLSPVADSRAVDRNTVRCQLESRDRSLSTHPSVMLEAVRPDSVYMILARGDEPAAARRYFRSEVSQPLSGRVQVRPVQGLGDEAKIASSTDGEDTAAEIVVRSGVLQVSVHYQELTYVENVHPASAPEAEQIVRTLAAELLKRIPPD